MSDASRVLVVEDEPSIALAVEDALLSVGHRVQVVDRCAVAEEKLQHQGADVLVLDRMLPGGDGLRWLAEKRRQGWRTPVLILSARGSEGERCEGLEGGADDYLAKPFSPRELVARVGNLLARSSADRRRRFELGGIAVDLEARTVDGIALSEHENGLLAYCWQHAGRVVSRRELLMEVWGYSNGPAAPTRAVDMCVTGLRRKMGPAASRLATVRGGGYRLDVEGR